MTHSTETEYRTFGFFHPYKHKTWQNVECTYKKKIGHCPKLISEKHVGSTTVTYTNIFNKIMN